jgi:fructokinase
VKVLGGVEGGGTKFVCAIGSGDNSELIDRREFATSGHPGDTIDKVVEYFDAHRQDLAAIGIASFGPVELNPDSPRYGYITSTPKPGWRNVDIVGSISRAFPGLPIGFDTDVNGAALAELRWGAAQNTDSFVYLTVGTGIGGGGMVQGRQIFGLLHPEMGHMFIPHDWTRDPFAGTCPFHGDCLQGLASGPAIEMRWGRRGETLPESHEAWPLEAHYLALGLASIIYILSPRRIILGGGVIKHPSLLPMIRSEITGYMKDCLEAPELQDAGIDSYIVRSALHQDAGVLGALALARQSLTRQPQ